jgi:DNA polymerase bacteriophage-type
MGVNNPPIRKPKWQQVLAQANYPETVLLWDFETYFDRDFSLKKLSVPEYVNDPRFSVLSIGHKWCGAAGTDFVFGAREVEKYIRACQHVWGDCLNSVTIAAHNCSFDMFIAAARYGVRPKYVVDTISLSRCWDSANRHDLKSLAIRFNLGEKGETEDFCGVSESTITEAQLAALKTYNTNDVELESKLLTLLLPKLENPAIELPLAQSTLELATRSVIRCDSRLGAMLVDDMQAKTTALVNKTGLCQSEISGNLLFTGALTEALEQAGEQAQRFFKPGKRQYNLAIAKTDPEREELLNHPSDRVRSLMEARISVKSTPLHIKRIEKIMRIASACNGLLPINLKYYGAITGRASGSDWNPQNLPPDLCGVLKSAPDHRILSCDLSAIEARVLAYLAEQQDLLAQFAAGKDTYCEFASKVLGKTVTPDMYEERQIGKVGILSAGYGTGARNFDDRDRPNLLFEKAGLDTDTADAIITAYRSTFTKIVAFWSRLEQAFRYTATKHIPTAVGMIRFHKIADCDIAIELPNGRNLHFHKVRCVNGKSEVFSPINKSWEPIYGGMLTALVTQATARDILMEAILRIEARGYKHCLQVHDSVVLHVPVSQVAEVKKIVEEEMTRIPWWAVGIPLACKSKVGARYS